jgi:hypothetical protein
MAPPSADLQASPVTAPVIYPPFINDSNLEPATMLQTKSSPGIIFIAGLVCLALILVLSVGAFVLLLTQGKKGLWKKLRRGSRKSDNQQGRAEEGARRAELRYGQDAEKGWASDYARQNMSTIGSQYRTCLHPIPEEPEDATIADRGYSTGIVTRPSESSTSLSSLSSIGSLKIEEDISEVEVQGQMFGRRLRKWDGPGNETRNLGSVTTFFPSTTTCDTLKPGWELTEDDKSVNLFEVRRAIAQNVEVTKARLVLVNLPASESREGDAMLVGGGLDGGCTSSFVTLSCSSLSSVGSSSMEVSSSRD